MFFIVRLSEADVARLWEILRTAGVIDLLGGSMISPKLLHQSLSCILDTRSAETGRRIGARCDGGRFELEFDSVIFAQGKALLTTKSTPPGFRDLIRALLAGFRLENLSWGRDDPSPHVTLSYDTDVMAKPIPIEPFRLVVDCFELIEVVEQPYGYRTLEHWSLGPPREPAPEFPF